MSLDNDIDTAQGELAALAEVVPKLQAELTRTERRVTQLKSSLLKKR